MSILVVLLLSALKGCLGAEDDFQRGNQSMIDYLEKRFLDQCPLAASLNLPMELLHQGRGGEELPVKFDMTFDIRRIDEIDDIRQTFSAYVKMQLKWTLPLNGCQPLTETEVYGGGRQTIYLPFENYSRDKDKTWWPKLLHANAVENNNVISDAFQAVSFSRTESSGVQASILIELKFNSVCGDFQLQNFPFDRVTCEIILTLPHLTGFSNPSYIQFRAHNVRIYNDIWAWMPGCPNKCAVVYGNLFTEADITLAVVLQRKSDYFIGCVIIPMAVLLVLQLSGLAIPPSHGDRPSFMGTVVLSFFVVLTSFYQLIPKTSQRIYLLTMIEFNLCVSVALTVYSAVAVQIAQWEWGSKQIGSGKFAASRIRLMDGFVFLISAHALAIVNSLGFAYIITIHEEQDHVGLGNGALDAYDTWDVEWNAGPEFNSTELLQPLN